MKKILLLLCVLASSGILAFAQVQPVWTNTINGLPDSAHMFPVKTLLDANSNVLVLSAYRSIPASEYKVVLKRFGSNGSLLWTFTFDNSGAGSPRAFDMVMDDSANCYIAGGLMDL